MRIIAGVKRGMKLFSPPPLLRFAKQSGGGSRPILDRVKQSLFDCLQKYNLPAGATVADLFSGVGSLGLESLSRGAEFAAFIEKDPKTASILEKNIAKAGFTDQSKVIIADAFKAGATPVLGWPKYDLVFVDPPYERTNDVGPSSDLADLMKILIDQTANNALVIVRTHKDIELPDIYGGFKIVDRRQWGSMAITFLARSGDDK
jgi:16S rRNA (guanine966-N2)-methyltransferase